jgi:hypothetical protein
MGCLAALNRFVSCFEERGLPLYELLKKSDSLHWVDEKKKPPSLKITGACILMVLSPSMVPREVYC